MVIVMKSKTNRELIIFPTKTEKHKYVVISYVSIFLLSLLFYKSFLISAVFGFICLGGLKRYERHTVEKKKALILREFNDFLYSIASSFEMGSNLVTALEDSEKVLESIYREKGILVEEVRKMRLEIINGNQREEVALINFSERVPIEDVRNFVEVYIFCKKIGGNINKVISKSSQIITEKVVIEREIRATMSQKKFEGQIITFMPILTVLLLNIFSPTYLEILYTTLAGRVIMTISMGSIVGAFLLMEKLTRIDI